MDHLADYFATNFPSVKVFPKGEAMKMILPSKEYILDILITLATIIREWDDDIQIQVYPNEKEIWIQEI